MKTFVIAYATAFDGCVVQKLVHNHTKEMAICEFLVERGWDVTWDDCTESRLYLLSDMFITAMELELSICDTCIVEVK